jgi:hypothetical protein
MLCVVPDDCLFREKDNTFGNGKAPKYIGISETIMRPIGVTSSKAMNASCLVENRNGRSQLWMSCVKLHLPLDIRKCSHEAQLPSMYAMRFQDFPLRFPVSRERSRSS